jgi:hypothetical protein
MDPEFKAQVDAIKDGHLDQLEQAQWEDAKIRPEDRRWVLSRQRPEEWSEKKNIAHTGKIEHTHRLEQMTDEQLEEIVGYHKPVRGEIVE